MVNLTQGAIKKIHTDGELVENPCLQVLECKPIANNNPSGVGAGGNKERYRIILSDGIHCMPAMLTNQAASIVVDETLQPKCLVRLNEYVCNPVANKNRKVIIVVNLEVVSPPQAKIGNPVNIENAPAATGAAADAGLPKMNPMISLNKPAAAAGSSNSAPSGGNNTFRQNTAVNRPPPGRDELQVYVPISKLGFHTNRWTLKVRCANKSDVREFTSQKLPTGKGRLMSVDLVDAEGGEIRATMFGDAVDLFGPVFEVGKVYEISKGGIKQAYKKGTSANKSDYEITLDRNSHVRLLDNDDTIPSSALTTPTLIVDIPKLNKDDFVDVLAVVYQVDGVVPVNTRNGSTTKRTIHLVDQSQGSIEMTLWGDKALKFDDTFTGVLGIKGAKVSDFNFRSLTAISSTQLTTNPVGPQSDELIQWFQALPSNFNAIRISTTERAAPQYPPRERKTLSQIKDEHLGSPEAFVFQTKAVISYMKREASVVYSSCPTPKCHKRVNLQNGKWHCDKCDAQFDDCDYSYMFSFLASDYTGANWLSAFNVAEKILNISAKDLNALKEAGQNEEYDNVFDEALFKLFNFVVRAKEDTYNGLTSVKCSVIAATPLDFVEESKVLITNIQQLLAD